jgi:hypothetical protein
MFFRRKDRNGGGATALAEPPAPIDDRPVQEILAEAQELTQRTREDRSVAAEQRLLRLRNSAGVAFTQTADTGVEFATPDPGALPQVPIGQLPEFTPDDLTPALLRAAILRDGCLLVRGLIPREAALDFGGQIDRAFEQRDRHDGGQPHDPAYYSEFVPDRRSGGEMARPWVKQGGGVLFPDAPTPAFNLLELFHAAGLPELVQGYLGEPPLIACQKTTLRKADPSVPGAWHQDGKFMGPVRALNLWLSLSRCGDESPGLDIVPTRLEHLVTVQTEEAMLDYMVSQTRAEQAAGEAGIIRPIFEPGDALFFDELFLHKTGSDPSMPKPRFAVESWFFGASAFAREYSPIAVA